MNETTTLTARFLAAIPGIVGYRPNDELLLLIASNAEPLAVISEPLSDPIPVGLMYTGALELVGEVQALPEAHVVHLVVFTSLPFRQAAEMPHSQLVGILADALTDAELLVSALCVAADGWGGYFCRGACCPPAGNALNLIDFTAPSRAFGRFSQLSRYEDS
ncbi:MAG: DUF4192 family protein [Cryobacterium sp.]